MIDQVKSTGKSIVCVRQASRPASGHAAASSPSRRSKQASPSQIQPDPAVSERYSLTKKMHLSVPSSECPVSRSRSSRNASSKDETTSGKRRSRPERRPFSPVPHNETMQTRHPQTQGLFRRPGADDVKAGKKEIRKSKKTPSGTNPLRHLPARSPTSPLTTLKADRSKRSKTRQA